MTSLKKITSRLLAVQPSFYILRLVSAWCFSSFILTFLYNVNIENVSTFANAGLSKLIIIFALCYILLSVPPLLNPDSKPDVYIFPVAMGAYFITLLSVWGSLGLALSLSCAAAAAIVWYSSKGYIDFDKIRLSKKKTAVLLTVSAVLFCTVVGGRSVIKCLSFLTPNFDHGLFVQMFRNICEHLKPVTTCERDTLMSHFSVHMSPILFVLTPIFKLFPSDITLELCQTVILASSVIPAFLLCRRLSMNNARSFALAASVLFMPAVSLGTNYDFHENCFLLPLLLWLFWAYESKKYVPMYIFAALTLLVKEDAAVYIVFFAVYTAVSSKKLIRPAAITAVAAVYFISVTYYLAKHGDGVMTNRYANFVTEDGSLFSMIKNVLVSPGFVFTQIFTSSDGSFSEKILFIIQMTAPLAFLPFAIKKVSRFILLCPMILINLMTMYSYQFDLGYQYCFGSGAFLVYLAALNLADMKKESADRMIACALCVSSMCFWGANIPNAVSSYSSYRENSEQYSLMRQKCESIPDGASVICSTMLLSKLYDRDTLYEIYYHQYDENEPVDYVVIDARFSDEEFVPMYESYGYSVTDTLEYNGKKLIIIMQMQN